MKLSIIIPTFNEQDTIEQLLHKVLKQDIDKEIIVVDDGSTDRTQDILNRFDIINLKHETNKGKGTAIRTGLSRAKGDLVIIQDADLEYDPNDYTKLLQAYDNNVVYGARTRNTSVYSIGARILTTLVNLLFRAHLTDIYTCYKLMPLKVLKDTNIQSRGFEIEAEITVKLLKKGISIKEIPINYYPRKIGKKIKLRDGINGIYTILLYAIQS